MHECKQAPTYTHTQRVVLEGAHTGGGERAEAKTCWGYICAWSRRFKRRWHTLKIESGFVSLLKASSFAKRKSSAPLERAPSIITAHAARRPTTLGAARFMFALASATYWRARRLRSHGGSKKEPTVVRGQQDSEVTEPINLAQGIRLMQDRMQRDYLIIIV